MSLRDQSSKDGIDYSLYLVTDSTKALLGDRDLARVVRDAIAGGVTVVQYRDKTSETGEIIRVAKELHKVTQQAGVPLLINDRVDVALAVGAEGVHLGQEDMDLQTARKLLGKASIIGATVSSVTEAVAAVRDEADYLGVGTVFATSTKENTKSIIGTAGVREILRELSGYDYGNLARRIPVVCIGGIKASNLLRVLWQSSPSDAVKRLSGVAVVSALISPSVDPKLGAQELIEIMSRPTSFIIPQTYPDEHHEIQKVCVEVVKSVALHKPLCHNMTNLVVQNFAANIALAIGGSPIMSSNGAEAADLAALQGSLVINMGTATPESMANYKMALNAYNNVAAPVLLDPVGGGATLIRRAAVKELLASGYFEVIKGNEAEILTVLGGKDDVQQHGVDSIDEGALSSTTKAEVVKALALRERNIVLMTGASDFLSDGEVVYRIQNGHEYLGSITGTGCSLGTTIAACLAVGKSTKLMAVLAGLLAFEIAAERAALRDDVKGTGTFVPAFIDELGNIKNESRTSNDGQAPWISAAKFEICQ